MAPLSLLEDEVQKRERNAALGGAAAGAGAVGVAGGVKINRVLKTPMHQAAMRDSARARGLNPTPGNMRAARGIASGMSGVRGMFTKVGAAGAGVGAVGGLAVSEQRKKHKKVQKNDSFSAFGIEH